MNAGNSGLLLFVALTLSIFDKLLHFGGIVDFGGALEEDPAGSEVDDLKRVVLSKEGLRAEF